MAHFPTLTDRGPQIVNNKGYEIPGSETQMRSMEDLDGPSTI